MKTNPRYRAIDEAILSAIAQRHSPLHSTTVALHASEIAEAMGRRPHLVIDKRLRALREAGRIVYRRPVWEIVKP
jgi:hypothetical protein